MRQQEPVIITTVRIPYKLHFKLAKLAEEMGISVNKCLILLLKQELGDDNEIK